jgi:hypothetical protein
MLIAPLSIPNSSRRRPEKIIAPARLDPSSQHKTVPVAIVNEFVDGDIYRWAR